MARTRGKLEFKSTAIAARRKVSLGHLRGTAGLGSPTIAAGAQMVECAISGQVRSGLLLGRSLGPCQRAKRKKTFESEQNEGAQMSNELESDRAMLMNLESVGVDGAGYDETETEPPSSTNPQ